MKKNTSTIVMLLSGLWFLCFPLICFSENNFLAIKTQEASPADLSLLKETKHALQMAYTYLIKSQLPNGSWKDDPAITALVLYSFMVQPLYNPDEKSAGAIKKGIDYVETFVQPDGGIYRKGYRNYVTAVCLMAFTETGLEKYHQIISDAKNFLIQFQLDESEDISSDHPFYGGIGYGGDDRPDLSNTQLALEAIKSAEDYEYRLNQILPADIDQIEREEKELGLHWEKALLFLSRCQNVTSVNTMPYAADDGGFIYETGTYKKDRSHSYGSMTYAGVKSLLYARVKTDDIRVQRAVSWIKNHYTLEENPGFGTVSLYYYYMTAAKCLDVLGQDVLVDNKGVNHSWREDMLNKLVSLQKEDGYWVNDNGRYWENIKDLVTAYAVIAIKFSAKGL